MNTKAKGSRNERRSRDLFVAEGYAVTKAGGSLGVWDLIAIGPDDVVLFQVKTNRGPSRKERMVMENFPCHWTIRRELHVWKDYARQPEVTVL